MMQGWLFPKEALLERKKRQTPFPAKNSGEEKVSREQEFPCFAPAWREADEFWRYQMNAETLALGKETLGEHLQRKREESGFSLQEISEKTRIRTYYLESIEKGEYHRLPCLPYNRGFVRAYAEYIGVDADAAATHFIIEAGLEAEVGMIPETSTESRA